MYTEKPPTFITPTEQHNNKLLSVIQAYNLASIIFRKKVNLPYFDSKETQMTPRETVIFDYLTNEYTEEDSIPDISESKVKNIKLDYDEIIFIARTLGGSIPLINMSTTSLMYALDTVDPRLLKRICLQKNNSENLHKAIKNCEEEILNSSKIQ
jgi:hypothetical protein